MTQEGKERVALFDNVKGVAIVLVVVGHFVERSMSYRTGSHLAQTILTFIYIFHMPVFIFCSGLFAGKSWRKNKRAPVDKFLLYLILYAVFCALVAVLDLVIFQRGSTLNPFALDSAPWFLLALAFMMLLVPLLGSLPAAPILVVSIALAVGAGLSLPSNTELTLLRVFTYFPYFAIGFYLTPERVQQFVEKVRGKLGAVPTMVAAILAFALIVVVLYAACGDGTLRGIKRMSSGLNLITAVAESSGQPLWLLVLFRILEYPVVLCFIALLFLAVPMKRCPLSALGERSLQVYIVHILILYALDYLGFIELMVASNTAWLLTVIAVGVALAAVLAIPRFPQNWVNKLGCWLKKVVSQESERA